MVVMQALVAAGLGVTTIPGLALRAHRVHDIIATELWLAASAFTNERPPDVGQVAPTSSWQRADACTRDGLSICRDVGEELCAHVSHRPSRGPAKRQARRKHASKVAMCAVIVGVFLHRLA